MTVRAKRYLGDSVWCAVDQYGDLVLTTEEEDRTTNTIVMDSTVVAAFLRFARQVDLGSDEEDDLNG